MKSARAITFDTRPSRRLEACLAAVAALAVAAILVSALPYGLPVCVVFAPVAAVVFARYRRSGSWRIAWREDDTWGVAALNGTLTDEATLLGWSAPGRWLVLRLQPARGRPLALVLLSDNASADLRRRLLVRLRRECAAPADVSLFP